MTKILILIFSVQSVFAGTLRFACKSENIAVDLYSAGPGGALDFAIVVTETTAQSFQLKDSLAGIQGEPYKFDMSPFQMLGWNIYETQFSVESKFIPKVTATMTCYDDFSGKTADCEAECARLGGNMATCHTGCGRW